MEKLLQKIVRHPSHQGERNHLHAAKTHPRDLAQNPDIHPEAWWALCQRGAAPELLNGLVSRELQWLQLEHVFNLNVGHETLMLLAQHNHLDAEECEMLDLPPKSILCRTLRRRAPERPDPRRTWPRTAAETFWRHNPVGTDLVEKHGEALSDWPVHFLVTADLTGAVIETLGKHLPDDPGTWEVAAGLAPEWNGTAEELAHAALALR